MEASFSVDSMIREVKTNLNKYAALLKNIESHPTEKTVKDVEKIKSTLDNNIKMVQPIIVKEEHKFLLNSYKELKDELNKRYVIIKKNQANKSDKEKLNELLSNKSNVENKNIDLLIDEKSSLKNSITLSNEINASAIQTNIELDDQEKKMGKTEEKVVKILKKVPIIEQMFGKIKYHKMKEKLIIGTVIGVIIVLGIYLTFYR